MVPIPIDPWHEQDGPVREGVDMDRTSHSDRPAPTGLTYHLVPAEVWEAQRRDARYRPEAFEADGFVHCTDGLDHLLVPANAYYRDDPRPYLALEVDLDAVAAQARFDDEACRYPHVYGPLDVTAVRRVLEVERDADGTFTGFVTT
jgi:uncharacterized protein (DUF952 family)